MITQIATVMIMAAFYAAYFLKMINQRKAGISTVILGKGNKPQGVKVVEVRITIISIMVVLVELMSIYWNLMELPSWCQWIGVGVAALGVVVFCMAIHTMQNNWRAGIPETRETSLVTKGIYRYSRNPAFVGFDLLYLGILIAFPNAWHACVVAAAAYIFHLQIINEEKYLADTFGEEYIEYKNSVRRYL